MTSKKNSLKSTLILFTGTVVLVIVILMSSMAIYSVINSTRQALDKSMKATANLAAGQITQQLDVYKTLAYSLTEIQELLSPTTEEMRAYLNDVLTTYRLGNVDILDLNGICIFDGESYADDNTFQQAKSAPSKFFLSDPIVDGDGGVTFDMAFYSEKYAVIISIPYALLGDAVSGVRIGETGSTYILDRNGAKVVHDDLSLVQQRQNNLDEVKKDPKTYRTVAELETKMTKGESGFGFYTWKGDKKLGSYAPVGGTNGWSINVTALAPEFMSQAAQSTIVIVVEGLVALIFATLLVVRIANGIVRPIREVMEAMDGMARGDLDIQLNVKNKNETGLIAGELMDLAERFRNMIADIAFVLTEIAGGNLNVHSREEYVGHFERIHKSMAEIRDTLNNTIGQIGKAADHVASSSEQVSMGAQALSQGAAEQASSVEQLAATVGEIASQVRQNADEARGASDTVGHMGDMITESNTKMRHMIAAMDEIHGSSSEIGKIMKTIDDIAFQTNILALNAAVEAARAGSAGKGFAVVADEVRNLAGKSQEASQNTAALVQNSIRAIENGSAAAKETADSLAGVVRETQGAVAAMNEIAAQSEEQSRAIAQVAQGVDEISSVVQTNSATAEQSAAASQEMSNQARRLESLVSHFKLLEKS